ncbi:hypothetical protein IV203_025093 [Nitzschia inconspicua]|uniref:Uncharacterized protein n=1 Tax=Nitzschia inconspicua TaxID=303405 RepID=A0A9K3PZB4_9STRA|nr:hypothetical protein IV203_025162 [Nitzschia inconspicua]KAG7365652.1 hypothetical protein IV203_025093 [Nitzschia inconspicua]
MMTAEEAQAVVPVAAQTTATEPVGVATFDDTKTTPPLQTNEQPKTTLKSPSQQQQKHEYIRSPPAILAVGAILDHILTCDCSFRQVSKVLHDETNDSLKLAYQHHQQPKSEEQALQQWSNTAAAF